MAGVLFALGSDASSCMADSPRVGPLPSWEIFFSENRRFALAIVAKQLEGKFDYFEDKARGRPHAFLYAVDPNHQLNHLTTFKLVDEVAPRTALVSDDGQYLVTVNNRWSPGYGSNAIVIYRADGSLIRSLPLEDILTTNDIERFPRSASGSITWGAGHYIDEDRHVLVLRIDCLMSIACSESPHVTINLDDGKPLRPARDLLPQPTVSLRPAETPSSEDQQIFSGDPFCAGKAFVSTIPEVPFDNLQPATTDLALPSYTEVARKARVQGAVILELLVEGGAVVCVKTIKGLPMGLFQAARDAALQWRFLPSPNRKGPVRSFVAFDFRFAVAQPASDE